jgi:DNA-binding MarR family transcriptional regulator
MHRAPSKGLSEEREVALVELGTALRQVLRGAGRMRGRDTHLLGSEVSHAQLELLTELHEKGPMSAGDLATAAGLTPATVTQMLDHLAECGHVERTRGATDRRVVVSRLTAGGQKKVEDKRALWHQRWEQGLAETDAEELLIATRVLGQIGAVFNAAN